MMSSVSLCCPQDVPERALRILSLAEERVMTDECLDVWSESEMSVESDAKCTRSAVQW